MINRTMRSAMVLTALSITTLLAAAQPASGRDGRSAATACSPDAGALTDIDGDGRDDVVVGRPVTAGTGVGAIDVHATCAGDALIPGSRFAGTTAAFGSSVALGAIGGEGDHYVDAVVGDPGTSSGGSVFLLLGSPDGLTPSTVRLDGRSAGERFGAAVAVVGDDVWVGAPDRTVDDTVEAGAVEHWRVTADSAVLVETITEESPDAHGTATVYAHFGSVLSAAYGRVWIGAPDDTFLGAPRAGSVTALDYGSAGTVTSGVRLTQDTPGVAGTPEADDHFGASIVVGAAIGVPGEDLGRIADAGMVQLFTDDTPGDAINQDVPGVPGTAESGDQFGASVAQLGPDVDWGSGYGVLIGTPGEGLGTQAHAGAVWFRWFRYDRVGAQWSVARQGTGTGGVGGTYEANDRFGQTLAVAWGNFDDNDLGEALVGTPGEDVSSTADAGLVSHYYPSYDGSTSYFAVGGNRAHLRYGTVLPNVAGLRPSY